MLVCVRLQLTFVCVVRLMLVLISRCVCLIYIGIYIAVLGFMLRLMCVIILIYVLMVRVVCAWASAFILGCASRLIWGLMFALKLASAFMLVCILRCWLIFAIGKLDCWVWVNASIGICILNGYGRCIGVDIYIGADFDIVIVIPSGVEIAIGVDTWPLHRRLYLGFVCVSVGVHIYVYIDIETAIGLGNDMYISIVVVVAIDM